MPIPFVKATACGNDFLIIDAIHVPADVATFTRAVCDRHLGVGADGVEWISSDPQCDARIRLVNADGTDAEISGNGTRCVAAYLVAERGGEVLSIRTDAGIKTCTLTSRAGARYEFEMKMGEPEVGDAFPIRLAEREVTGVPVSMGNPHYVLFVESFGAGWQTEAAEIERHPDFKHGTNVELVRVVSKEDIEIRIFERGVGETQSSGTGSCASAVAAIHTRRAESPLRVHAPGGTQLVKWDEEVVLRGPAQLICRGEILA